MKILIADDKEENLYLLETLLKGSGYEVVSAVNGAEALEKLRAEGADMIISDILMPVMDGFQLCRECKGDEELRRIPFVFYTATYTDGKDEAFALKIGADRYVRKPLQPDEFMKVIRGLISDAEAGKVGKEPVLVDEKEVFKLYSERLVNKLERKMLALEEEIAERKLAEEALRRSEQSLAEAQRIAHIGNWEWDITRTEVRWSDEVYRIFGKAPEEYEPAYEAFFDCVHPDDRDFVKKSLDEAVYDASPYNIEHRIVLPDGSERVVNEQGEVTFDTAGRAIRMVGTLQDVTERKELEAQFRQAQKMEAVGRLAGGVAHDFNNVLTGISGYAQLLLKEAEPGSLAHDDLTQIYELAKRAAGLTRQLLAFSRSQPLTSVVLNINSLVENTAKMLKRLIGEDIDLSFTPGPDLGNVRADPGQIEQVLMNLAVNARDAMPEGGKLTIETENAALDQEYADSHEGVVAGPYVTVGVSDSGCGMDKATLEHIFEPFFTTKEGGKGTGLGLATVYGIVKQHGGTIWVYSEPGMGTTFRVYLPRVTDEAERMKAERPAEEPVRGTETILLVEDEEAIRDLAKRVLKQQGYEVLAAATAEEAEEVFGERGGNIDLVLTDVVMPGRGGLELYERLAAYRSSLKVLYVSGYSETAFIPRELLKGGAGFLQKPFAADDLTRKVREVLDSGRATGE